MGCFIQISFLLSIRYRGPSPNCHFEEGGVFDAGPAESVGVVPALKVERSLVAVKGAGRDAGDPGRDHGPGAIPVFYREDMTMGSAEG
jgi:hypothetical protein